MFETFIKQHNFRHLCYFCVFLFKRLSRLELVLSIYKIKHIKKNQNPERNHNFVFQAMNTTTPKNKKRHFFENLKNTKKAPKTCCIQNLSVFEQIKLIKNINVSIVTYTRPNEHRSIGTRSFSSLHFTCAMCIYITMYKVV